MVANFFDAHTAARFLAVPGGAQLRLSAWETLSPSLIPNAEVREGQGLIGWVAKEGRSLHVTRFTRDTRTLGIYSQDVHIKAFLAVPLPGAAGVMMVDSKNRYAFTDKKQRILEGCARVAADLHASLRHGLELDFYRRYGSWVSRGFQDVGSCLHGLVSLFKMEQGLVAWQAFGSEELKVLAVSPGKRTGKIEEGMVVKGTNGLAAWILSHRKGIRLARHAVDPHRSFLLYPEEEIGRGRVVMGFYQEGKGGHAAWLITGDGEVQGLPGGVMELVSSVLRERFWSR